MKIKHACQSCVDVMAVHDHDSYQEIKACLRGLKPLCESCASWLGSPLPSEGTRGQGHEP